MARDESTLKESGVETLKHLGAVGVADALMKGGGEVGDTPPVARIQSNNEYVTCPKAA